MALEEQVRQFGAPERIRPKEFVAAVAAEQDPGIGCPHQPFGSRVPPGEQVLRIGKASEFNFLQPQSYFYRLFFNP
jgi:hypothetical protein